MLDFLTPFVVFFFVIGYLLLVDLPFDTLTSFNSPLQESQILAFLLRVSAVKKIRPHFVHFSLTIFHLLSVPSRKRFVPDLVIILIRIAAKSMAPATPMIPGRFGKTNKYRPPTPILIKLNSFMSILASFLFVGFW